MAIRFYCDEHVDPAIAKALRTRGVDVLTAQEAGMLGVPDEDHLQLADFTAESHTYPGYGFSTHAQIGRSTFGNRIRSSKRLNWQDDSGSVAGLSSNNRRRNDQSR